MRRVNVKTSPCFGAIVSLLLSLAPTFSFAKDSLNLDNPLGHHRLLVLCLLDDDYIEDINLDQIYNDTDWAGFNERDLFFIEMTADSWSIVRGSSAAHTKAGRTSALWQRFQNKRTNSKLRQEAGCERDFEFVLIGNDGTQKMRWLDSIPENALFETIDAMPFRQYEMRQLKLLNQTK